MKMKNFTILIFGVGMVISANILLGQPSEEPRDFLGQTQSERWIGDWQPSNKQTKVFVDGQHRATIRSGGTSNEETIYIRSKDGESDRWKRFRVEEDGND